MANPDWKLLSLHARRVLTARRTGGRLPAAIGGGLERLLTVQAVNPGHASRQSRKSIEQRAGRAVSSRQEGWKGKEGRAMREATGRPSISPRRFASPSGPRFDNEHPIKLEDTFCPCKPGSVTAGIPVSIGF
jgi:hypothetical protein